MTSGRRGYANWLPRHPIPEARRTHMGIRVHIKPEDRTFGMYNTWPTHRDRDVPLCQFQLE